MVLLQISLQGCWELDVGRGTEQKLAAKMLLLTESQTDSEVGFKVWGHVQTHSGVQVQRYWRLTGFIWKENSQQHSQMVRFLPGTGAGDHLWPQGFFWGAAITRIPSCSQLASSSLHFSGLCTEGKCSWLKTSRPQTTWATQLIQKWLRKLWLIGNTPSRTGCPEQCQLQTALGVTAVHDKTKPVGIWGVDFKELKLPQKTLDSIYMISSAHPFPAYVPKVLAAVIIASGTSLSRWKKCLPWKGACSRWNQNLVINPLFRI